jgi:hypothetical protein
MALTEPACCKLHLLALQTLHSAIEVRELVHCARIAKLRKECSWKFLGKIEAPT